MSAKIIDGRSIAEAQFTALEKRIAALPRPPRLLLVVAASAADTSFLKAKRRAGEQIGVRVDTLTFPDDATVSGFRRLLNDAAGAGKADGIVVQLPLPERLDRSRHALLRVIPEEQDVDCISERWLGRLMSGRMSIAAGKKGTAALLPPVVGAIASVAKEEGVTFSGRRVLVVGWGDLVGKPVAAWLMHQGATVTVATSTEKDLADLAGSVEVIISGAGSAGLITSDMVQEGAVLFDAGTSEDAGTVVGDVAPAAAERASLMTPVPGGIGPLTVAALYENLVSLCEARYRTVPDEARGA